MKKFIYLSLSLCFFLFQTSCEITETNIDPTKIHDVDLRLMLPTAISQTAFNQTNTTLRIAGTFMQQYIMGGACVTYSDYRVSAEHFSNYWNTGLYAGSLKDCRVIIDKAREMGQPYYEGIAKVLMAKELGNSSLMFGDLPFSEALDGTNRFPNFDTQEEVMQSVFSLLDEAILLFEQDAVQGGPANDDFIFKGDGQAWLKTAWALKARYHMQMSHRDPEAATKVLDALDKAFGSLEEQPSFKWGKSLTEMSPLARFGTERPYTMVIDERFPKKFLQDDPRSDKYAFFNGSEWEYYSFSDPSSLYWSAPDVSVPIISYVELAFLKAEALWLSGADATNIQEAMEQGIENSMIQVTLESTDYQDYMGSLESLADMTRAEQLEYIMIEAYKAYFGYAAIQTWANYRRTGYPNIKPSDFGSHGLNPGGGIPKRFLYPTSEATSNPENMAAAQARQNGALMDATLWIFE